LACEKIVERIIKGVDIMSEHCCGMQVGENVTEFKMETYEPSKGDFGEVSLGALKAAGKWTVLFFYPADFTFV
jgi:NADH-dependent peroxiredoxin subunit C